MRKCCVTLLILLVFLTACSVAAPTATPTSAPSPTASSSAAPTAASLPSGTPLPLASAAATTPTTRVSTPASSTASTPAGTPAARSTATRSASPAVGSARATGTVPQISPNAGAALVEQAIGNLLDHYVDPLSTVTLYGVAYQSAVAILQASGGTPQAQSPTLTGDRKADASAFQASYLTLANAAGPAINQNLLAYETIRAVAVAIDECHTAFLDPAQYTSVNAGLSGKNTYGGIGVTIRTQTRPVTIGGIFPNTPAAQSGLRPGDQLLKVGDTDVSDLPADAISPLVRGEAGTTVVLTIGRAGESAPLIITITRAEIQVPIFTSEILTAPNGAKIGYMKLYSFSTGAVQQLQDALDQFAAAGVTGWVLDLRDNGGGYIDVLSQIGSRFLSGRQPIAYEIARGGTEQPISTDPSKYLSAQQPFAVLINGGSASASEALASSAADYGFARLFGQKTAGCLAGASTYRLADNSAIQVTIWKIVSPQHREINRVGQQPDEVVDPDPTGATDPVLNRAIAWLITQPPR